MLIDCDHARSVWLAMNINVSQSQNLDIVGWIASCFFFYRQDCDTKEITNWNLTLMCTARQIWKNKYIKVFQNKSMNKLHTTSNIHNLISHCSTLVHTQDNRNYGQNKDVWYPPKNNHLKINIDASYDPNT